MKFYKGKHDMFSRFWGSFIDSVTKKLEIVKNLQEKKRKLSSTNALTQIMVGKLFHSEILFGFSDDLFHIGRPERIDLDPLNNFGHESICPDPN
jgi:hypothetical protein